MNLPEQRVQAWLDQNNIPYTKEPYGFKTCTYAIKCVGKDQSVPVWKEPGDRIVMEHALDSHFKTLTEWDVKHPVVKLDKMSIQTNIEGTDIVIRGFYNDRLIATSTFWIESDQIYWFKIEYNKVHIPGWLSKSVKEVERLKLGLPITCATNSRMSAYEKIGFRIIGQHDALWLAQRLGFSGTIYKHPENIIIWNLQYDCINAI